MSNWQFWLLLAAILHGKQKGDFSPVAFICLLIGFVLGIASFAGI